MDAHTSKECAHKAMELIRKEQHQFNENPTKLKMHTLGKMCKDLKTMLIAMREYKEFCKEHGETKMAAMKEAHNPY